MAFYPAHCDDKCRDCEKNICGWCIWKDRATPYYLPQKNINTLNNE